jgi:uncharacterized phage protein gp47/JayE
MANILKTYTADQLYTLYKNKTLSDNVGLTDFNSGSRVRSLLESNSEIVSSIAMDFKEALYRAIPIALYEGFGFTKTGSVAATGYLRPYRLPALILTYSGAGTAALITSTSTGISATVTGASGDNFNFLYSTYSTLTLLRAAIDALTNWTATLVKDGSVAATSLYQYSAKDVKTSTNYINTTGSMDVMLNTATAISVTQGFEASINSQTFITTTAGTIAAGASSATIASTCTASGADGNISASAIDTRNGKGFINSNIAGIEYVINDSSFSGGSDAETDIHRQTRFSNYVNALNAGTANGIIAAIGNITGVNSVGIRTSYPMKGTNTIIVDDGTGTMSATLLAAVEKVLYGSADDLINYPGKNAEGIGYSIVAPTIVSVNVNIAAVRLSSINVDLTTIATDIKTAVEQYINTRTIGEDVIWSEINRIAKDANAAVYDLTINTPTDNIVIDASSIARTGSGTSGTVTVTVSISSSS